METIAEIWFNGGRIFIRTSSGKVLSRPLEAFPRLLEANEAQRQAFKIGKFADDVRWEEIDEDIHISSFFETGEPNRGNEVEKLFAMFPLLNVSEVARMIGINKSLLSKYIYGISRPSPERVRLIKAALNKIARSLADATA